MEVFSTLLDISRFMPHGMCFLWRSDLLALHVGSDVLIAGSYFSIPAAMLVLLKKRPDLPKGIFRLFVAFIMLCGITHLASIVVIWYPAYYIEGMFKLATALVSLTTAILLWPLIPKAAAVPSIQEMEARNLKIEELNRKLQQRISSLSTLAGGVSHEFNNLLTIIAGNAELLDMVSSGPEQKSRIASIKRAADRATDVCSKMLAYSGHGHFMLSEIDLNREIRHSDVQMIRGCNVKLELDEGIGPVNASPRQLQLLLQYLCTNAAEAIEESGRKDGEIRIATYRAILGREELDRAAFEHNFDPGQAVILEIRDNGIGMSQVILDQLFEPYFTTRFTGRGLGMSAVQGILRGHECCMFIDSVVGEGTTIRIAYSAIKAVSTRYCQPRNAAPGVILVVDDEEDITALAASYLNRLGKKVYQATDSREALEIFRKYKDEIDTVILDYLMPGMTGIELRKAIAGIADVDAYLTSGYTRGEITDPAYQAILTGFIAKPFVFEDFEELFGKG